MIDDQLSVLWGYGGSDEGCGREHDQVSDP